MTGASLTARQYQTLAVDFIFEKWGRGERRGCLVSPTGSGKTHMADMVMDRLRGKRGIFIAHTEEIVRQTAEALRKRFPFVGIVMADEPLTPGALIQVATIQTLLKRGFWPDADFVILDECHHYVSDEWMAFRERYPDVFLLGLTATPQRADGRPLGEIFQWLHVAAQYSELIALGHCRPCKAYQPPEIMLKGIACDPLKAWQRYGQNALTFGFANSVKNAKKFAEQFRDAGIPSAHVTANTPKGERRHIIKLFSKGDIRVLWNMKALTEGVNVPEAGCIIIAKQYKFAGQYMQAAGRARALGRDHSIIIDLAGATLIHGLPTEDREFTLDGDGMKRTTEAPLKNCLSCGATILSAYPTCPECGFVFPKSTGRQEIKIYSFELREVYAGQATAIDAKRKEFARLLAHSKARDWSVSWAVTQYEKLFNEKPDMSDVSDARRYDDWVSLQRTAHVRGFKRGFAYARYKTIYGENPPRSWKSLSPRDLALLAGKKAS